VDNFRWKFEKSQKINHFLQNRDVDNFVDNVDNGLNLTL